MALRDQPYLPLFVQDFLTDEKLIECSAQATGVYARLMCIMHKSTEYGRILLKQKDKQTDKQINNFANKLAKQMPYSFDTILASLNELLSENVIHIDGDFLCQKRMIEDNEISLKRSKSGKLGGIASSENKKNFAVAKVEANTEYENEYEIQYNKNALTPKMVEVFKLSYPFYPIDEKTDFPSCLQIAYKIAKQKGWMKESVLNGNMTDTLEAWGKIVAFSTTDKWYATRSISDFNKEFQRLVQGMVQGNKKISNQKEVSFSTAPPLSRLNQD